MNTEVAISGTRIQPKVDESIMTATPTEPTMAVFTMLETIFLFFFLIAQIDFFLAAKQYETCSKQVRLFGSVLVSHKTKFFFTILRYQ
jgi:hypothetical protein